VSPRYVLTLEAERDLNDIWTHISAQSVDSADAVVREIREALELISSLPRVGHERKDVRDPRYRFWRANRFIIAYHHESKPLQIIRIIGGSRDFRQLFQSPSDLAE